MALTKIQIGDPMWGFRINDRIEETERRLRRMEVMVWVLMAHTIVGAVTDLIQNLTR